MVKIARVLSTPHTFVKMLTGKSKTQVAAEQLGPRILKW